MGIENNECILAVTWNADAVGEIKNWVLTRSEIEQKLFCFIPAIMNGKTTIILAADGSKKGWETAKLGDAARAAFIEKLESFAYKDGSSQFDWVEVGFGEYGQKILRGNNKNCYSDTEYHED